MLYRFALIVRKELLCIRENPLFHLVAVLSPLFFLAVFTFMLSDGVSFPFHVSPADRDTAFLRSAETFAAPNGIGYLELVETPGDLSRTSHYDALAVAEDPVYEDGALHGTLIHYINDVDQNALKNSRNRVDGALVHYIEQVRPTGNVAVREETVYPEDVPWDAGFGTSVFVFGFLLSGLFLGALSIVAEHDDRTVLTLRLAPCPSLFVLGGKLCAGLLGTTVSGLIFYAAYACTFRRFAAHPLALIGLGLLTCLAFLCVGMLIGIALKTAVSSLVACMGTAMTLWILGGGFGPLTFFGRAANLLAAIDPITYVVKSVRWCYFDGTAPLLRDGLVPLLSTAAAVLACGAVYRRWTAKTEG